MKTILKIITLVAALALLAGPAAASTVLYEQRPDPLGWDIAFGPGIMLADDWMWQGPYAAEIQDFHIWHSWSGDITGDVTAVTLSIWSNNPGGTGIPSHPEQMLWTYTFAGEELLEPTLYADDANQGWFNPFWPAPPGVWWTDDHHNIYQADFYLAPENYFLALPGVTYWLAAQVFVDSDVFPGWKTSIDHWMDDGVWGLNEFGDWVELRDPETSESLDLAFAVTGQMVPAPPALLLLGPGLMLVWGYRRRRS